MALNGLVKRITDYQYAYNGYSSPQDMIFGIKSKSVNQ
jgi:hypothetical protein